MRRWDEQELALFASTDEMQIAPLDPDGTTYRRPTVIWMMVVDGALYARAGRGLRSRWYQAAIAQGAGRITVAGHAYEVAFEREDPAQHDAVEDAMRTKYAHSPFLSPTAPTRTRQAGVRITPRTPRHNGEHTMTPANNDTIHGTAGVPLVELHDGTSIPQLGFGTLDVPAGAAGSPDEAETARIVSLAIEAGYRHFDSAQGYMTERGVGRAVRESGLPREDFYITTKLANDNHRPDDVRRSFDETMAKLGLPYLDLFLMHWPLPTQYGGDYVSTWRAMTELLADGRVRSVGVSNFQPDHLDRIIAETGVVPVVNQVELHPQLANAEVRAACARHGIAIEAWSPLAQARYLDDPVISRIAAADDRTPAQIILRWHIQQQNIVIPKTSHPDRMAENLAVFDFTLSDPERDALTALDRGEAGRNGPHPDEFDWIPEPAK